MPEDAKKSDKKNAKEQRKPRQRHQQAKNEKKSEKIEEPITAPKVTVPPKPPVYETPPPEFFKNLKRETDDILKITEEESSKYKKKEIQSNWSKYEVQIESYEEIDEQENMGADYEKLIQAPLVAGGHFQFKHEKSWDINTGPTQYDKYFEINMEDLNSALCAIPFYKRNDIEQSTFRETEILTMNNRATKFKQKYFNDKSYATPETEAHDKILNSLRESMNNDDMTKSEEKCNTDIKSSKEIDNTEKLKPDDLSKHTKDINLENTVQYTESDKVNEDNFVNPTTLEAVTKTNVIAAVEEFVHDDFIFGTTEKPEVESSKKADIIPKCINLKVTPYTEITNTFIPAKNNTTATVETKVTHVAHTVAEKPQESKKNPVIESPEDLEKWLDDFLDD